VELPVGARRPVISDVARAAGVSVPTVSRVLNGTAVVSAHKRDLVLAAVQQLGYRPNGAARALVTGRPSMVSVLTSNTTHFGYATTIQGIEEAARRAGLIVAITVIDSEEPAAVAAVVDLVLGQQIAGGVVLEFDRLGTRALEALPLSLPVAVVSSWSDGPEVPRVLFDDRQGGWDATSYLLGLGHRTVHHVSVPASGRPSGRTLGWRAALHEAGAVVPEVIEADWTTQSGFAAGLILAATRDCTAVLCGNDEIAFGVIKALQRSGRDVPGDVSVVGFDDHPLAAYWSPALTTVGQDFAQLGRAALGFLIARWGGQSESAPDTGPPQHLITRDSSGPPRR
jgi:DNA-binding LacI/PurR family transcriptional regulator